MISTLSMTLSLLTLYIQHEQDPGEHYTSIAWLMVGYTIWKEHDAGGADEAAPALSAKGTEGAGEGKE
jgi:hypothetical protein